MLSFSCNIYFWWLSSHCTSFWINGGIKSLEAEEHSLWNTNICLPLMCRSCKVKNIYVKILNQKYVSAIDNCQSKEIFLNSQFSSYLITHNKGDVALLQRLDSSKNITQYIFVLPTVYLSACYMEILTSFLDFLTKEFLC